MLTGTDTMTVPGLHLASRSPNQMWVYIGRYGSCPDAQFKTLEYRPDFPERFGSVEGARAHSKHFFPWYNGAYCHGGVSFTTPESVHCK